MRTINDNELMHVSGGVAVAPGGVAGGLTTEDVITGGILGLAVAGLFYVLVKAAV